MGQKDTVKPWFKKGAYPTDTQFSSLFDDIRFNDTPLAISEVTGLGDAINSKADALAVAAKADQTYVDTGLGNKLDATKKPIVSTIAGLRALSTPAADVVYITTDNGGGQWYHDPADVISADNTGTVLVTSDNKRLKRIVQGDYLVKWFGAVGDGVTDETALLNSIVQAVPANANLIFEANKVYNISDKIVLTKAINIIGNKARLNKTSIDGTAISIRSSDVSITNLQVNGAGYASYVGYADLIITENSSEASYYDNIKIEKCSIYNSTKGGISLAYVTNFNVNYNTVYNFPYQGIQILSGKTGLIKGNNVSNITGIGATDNNCYGIAISAYESDITTTDSLSSDVLITENIIKDVPLWEGLDTHGGQNLTFSFNKVINALTGIAVVGFSGTHVIASSHNISVLSNTIISDATNPTDAGCAIRVAGISDVDANLTECTCTNNQCISGMIYYSSTKNGVISANTSIKSKQGSGIFFDHVNDKINIINNIIQDPHSSVSSNTNAIGVSANGTLKGLISANVLKNTGFVNPYNSALPVGNYGIQFFATGSNVIFGENDFSSALAMGYTGSQQPTRFIGAGSPEGVKTAVVGSTFIRTDGGVGSTFYIKQTGTGNTGWSAAATGLDISALGVNSLPYLSAAGTLSNSPVIKQTSGGTAITVATRVAIGKSSTGYGAIGENIAFQSTANSYFYNGTDFAVMIDLASGKIAFKVAPSGTGLTAITFLVPMTITNTGNILIGTITDDTVNKLQVAGALKAAQFKLSALNAAPASATDTGTLGEIRIDGNFIYVCIATNTWVRSALTTW